MIFYSIIFILSVGGIAAIVRRNPEEFKSFNFAEFMENVAAETKDVWHAHLRERSFTFLEKRLRNVRIWVLKTERLLFNAVRGLRGIKEKNGHTNSDGANGNDRGDNVNLNQ